MLTHLRDSIHSDPESGLLYLVSRVYDDKDLRLTMCDRVLILPNEKILASSAKSVPAGGSESVSKARLTVASYEIAST